MLADVVYFSDSFTSSFQSHIKNETAEAGPKPNNYHQQDNTEEKTKPFRCVV